jgi:hypothetical protein
MILGSIATYSVRAFRIFGMRANPADDHHACVVGHPAFESVPASFDVEDYDAPRQETCRCVQALDVLRREPSGRLGIGNPVLDPWTRGAIEAVLRNNDLKLNG